MKIRNFLPWAGLSALLVLQAQTPAYAEIEEIVVVAQKRSESVQDVPISIAVFTGDELARRGATDLQVLARSVPNLDIPRSNNSRNAAIRIRGMGSSGSNPGIEASVGTFLDGLYMPTGAQSIAELTDIQNIEILRGPQGTLYGRNTPVGAINITTRRPTSEFESLIRVGAGDYEHKWINGYVGGELSESLAGRVSFYYRDRDGYEKNRTLGNNANDNSEKGIRGRLLFTLSDDVEVNFTAYVSRIDRRCCVAEQIDPLGANGIATPGYLAAAAASGYPFMNFDDNDHVVYADDQGDDQTDNWGSSIQVDWTLANDFLLTSITGFQDWENTVQLSADSLPQPVADLNQVQHNKILSEEIRLTSPSSDKMEYILGLYLYGQDTTFDTSSKLLTGATRVFPFPGCTAPCTLWRDPNAAAIQDFTQETRSTAAFGNFTFHMSEVWDLTAGVRWSRDKKDAIVLHYNTPGTGLPNAAVFRENRIGDVDLSDTSTTWSLNTRYHFTDDIMGFIAIGTGAKSAGFNSTRVPPGTTIEFDGESSISYEAGIKSTLLDRRLQLNATLYKTTVEDFQETSFNIAAGTGFIVGNAGERVSQGLEAELIATPMDGLNLGLNLAYLDAEYTDYPNAQCDSNETPDNANGTCNRKGETPAFAPKLKYSASAEYEQPMGDSNLFWRMRADYSWVDDQNLVRVVLTPEGDQASYGLVNLRFTIGSVDDTWEVSAFVDNATDEAYFIQANAMPLGALIPAGGNIAWYGPPRTAGLQLTWRPGS